MNSETEHRRPAFAPDAFSRSDENDDAVFYGKDRFVSHLDRVALETVEWIIGRLAVECSPRILDLMAGWDSHIPGDVRPGEVIGLGLNRNELLKNRRLSGAVVHDLNKDPRLPFGNETFDIVLNTVSVDYVTRPLQIFVEVGRILKPGGLFLVIFSNRMFPEKAVKIWQDSSEEERVRLVLDYFGQSGAFETAKVFVSEGKARPGNDKYAPLGIPSDPVFAVYADKKGGAAGNRPELTEEPAVPCAVHGASNKTADAWMFCPHCGQRLNKWATPNDPFSTWDTDYMYICFNDSCPFVVKGWSALRKQGNRGMSCRYMYNPVRHTRTAIPIINLHALKERIVEDC